MRSILFGIAASVGCILTCLVFLYWNPYSSDPPEPGTVRALTYMLILPACLGLVASALRSRLLMYAAFAWSLPCGLYLGVAAIPSYFNVFLVLLALYLVAAAGFKPLPRFRRSGRMR
ncbi:hypothetical protein [Cohnella nanjingensis]|uniref:Uncharacterized protein n=1 Tax=Cohnella nanjingensis TaxID=1387779 RepID=A0A7X0VEN0_9BACL|nr:hypothetical protein [Cohnella nanjingensis]MBB6671182.1 hypothetical protein [Cohnella nanjingensis]